MDIGMLLKKNSYIHAITGKMRPPKKPNIVKFIIA
jgi:hypothetical protein